MPSRANLLVQICWCKFVKMFKRCDKEESSQKITLTNLKGCGSPGLVVMGGDSCSNGRGFESQQCILDGHFSHIFVVKIGMMFV